MTTPTTPEQPVAEPAADDTASGPTVGLVAGGGMAAGLVGAAPALLPAVGACLSCLGVGTAAAAGVAGAAGLSIGGIALGMVALVTVAAVRTVEARRACTVGPTRTRRTLLTLASLAGWAIVSFAAVQWILVPLLTRIAGGSPPPGQLP